MPAVERLEPCGSPYPQGGVHRGPRHEADDPFGFTVPPRMPLFSRNIGTQGVFVRLTRLGSVALTDSDGWGAWVVCNLVGCTFEGPAGDFALDDARVGPAASL
ncbi:hypothetical protein GCM10022206_74070 [Streptomyces chiangmaiensis]